MGCHCFSGLPFSGYYNIGFLKSCMWELSRKYVKGHPTALVPIVEELLCLNSKPSQSLPHRLCPSASRIISTTVLLRVSAQWLKPASLSKYLLKVSIEPRKIHISPNGNVGYPTNMLILYPAFSLLNSLFKQV